MIRKKKRHLLELILTREIYTCDLLQKSLESRQYIRACVWSIKVVAVTAQLDLQILTSPSNASLFLETTNKNNQLYFIVCFFFSKIRLCLFLSFPFREHSGKDTVPSRQVWARARLWPRASFVVFFVVVFFPSLLSVGGGCSGYALEWIRSTWSKTTVGLGGIFLSRVWSHCLRKARYRRLW